MTPSAHHIRSGTGALISRGLVARQPTHHVIGYQSDLSHVLVLPGHGAGRASPRRNLAALRSRPFFSRPKINDVCHLLTHSLVASVCRSSEDDTGAFQKDGKIFQTIEA